MDREDFAIEGVSQMDSRTMSPMDIEGSGAVGLDSETLSVTDESEARQGRLMHGEGTLTTVSQLEVSMSSVDLNEATVTADPISEDAVNDLKNSTIDLEDYEYSSDEDFGEISCYEEEDLVGADSSDSDPDYLPRICIRTGGALEKALNVDDLPEVDIEQTLYDLDNEEEEVEDEEQDQEPEQQQEQQQQEDLEGETHAEKFPVEIKVLCEDDIIGVPASIVYHNSLKQLVQYLSIPSEVCRRMNRATRQQCGASKPFDVVIKQIGTAAVVEWVCPKGHIVWKWSSQPILKYGMHAGDFLLSSNIVLSGNNYAKVPLLFKFMNMRIVNEGTFYRVQEHCCVDIIKEFWDTKRMEIIKQLQLKPSVV